MPGRPPMRTRAWPQASALPAEYLQSARGGGRERYAARAFREDIVSSQGGLSARPTWCGSLHAIARVGRPW